MPLSIRHCCWHSVWILKIRLKSKSAHSSQYSEFVCLFIAYQFNPNYLNPTLIKTWSHHKSPVGCDQASQLSQQTETQSATSFQPRNEKVYIPLWNLLYLNNRKFRWKYTVIWDNGTGIVIKVCTKGLSRRGPVGYTGGRWAAQHKYITPVRGPVPVRGAIRTGSGSFCRLVCSIAFFIGHSAPPAQVCFVSLYQAYQFLPCFPVRKYPIAMLGGFSSLGKAMERSIV